MKNAPGIEDSILEPGTLRGENLRERLNRYFSLDNSGNLIGEGLSAVSQNQPAMVEIKGVKTGHFMERKTAPLACLDAGLMGHVERPQSEPSNHDIQSARSRMSERRIGRGLGISRETVGRYLLLARLANPAISTPGVEGTNEAKPAISTPRQNRWVKESVGRSFYLEAH
jgi:hypothetical protein